MRPLRLPESPLVRLAFVLGVAGGVAALLYFRGPNWDEVGNAFTFVRWEWVAAAVGINLLSIVMRSIAWRVVIDQALPPPRPPTLLVFSAFCVGLFANAVLPGRVGELARVWVLRSRLPRRPGTSATLVGTVFAHRVFDLVPSLILIVYVLLEARVPEWATTSLIAVVGIGAGLMTFAVAVARRGRVPLDGKGRVRRFMARTRLGLGVMRTPTAAGIAILFQCLGWLCQFFAVFTTMRAFNLHLGFGAAGLVLVLINVATILPLWPGNVGITQAAIALPLHQYYGVAVANGFAFGVGLQAIEASVGIGIGLLFLAREGLSFAMLRGLGEQQPGEESGEEDSFARARVAG